MTCSGPPVTRKTMKPFFLLTCFLFTMIISTAQTKLTLLIGTYTKTGKSEGIYVYEFDTATGKAAYRNKATGVENPSYLAIAKGSQFVYAVNEGGPGKGAVSSFSFDKETGTLKMLNQVPSNGDSPCYVAVTEDRDHLFVGNYTGGSLSAIPIQKDGTLGSHAQVIRHEGSGVNKERQEKPHVHSTGHSPDEKFLVVSDLGTDKITVYRYDRKKETPLSAGSAVSVPAGNGPRHFEFHPSKPWAYSVQELTGNVSAFTYKNGELMLIQNISGLPDSFTGKVWAADIHVSPDGRFLYSSNRDDANDIGIFAIDQKTGKLNRIASESTLGKAPRNFVITPAGDYLLAANQNTDNVVIFKRDVQTGLLKDTGERISVGAPVCLKFAD
jgi:6-phosphogluconolactonase